MKRDHDHLDRLRRDELPQPEATLSAVLDEWLHRAHGVMSGFHGVGLLLDLLEERGLQVVPAREEEQDVARDSERVIDDNARRNAETLATLRRQQGRQLAADARAAHDRMSQPSTSGSDGSR